MIKEIHCSKLSRPMTCAGSLFFVDLPKTEAGEAAKEGTACGEYLERLLTGRAIGTHAENGVKFDDDMKFYASEAAKNIKDRAQSEVLCEQKIDWVTRSGIVIAGKYDASYVHDGKLCIDDLKYGWKIVDVKENWQLLGYAIGEVIRRQQSFKRIVLRIIQPRPHHEDGPIREWEITYEQLLDFKEQIEERMDKIAAGFRELVTSEKCKYCEAASYACPAFNRAVFHGIDYVMGDFKQDSLNEKEIAFQLDILDRTAEILKIKKESMEQLAISQIKEGKIIPNWMAEQSFGDRQWKKDVSPKVIEMLTGIKIIKEEMLSPAQAEKRGVSKDLIVNYVDRFYKGMKLKRKDVNALGNKIFGNEQPKGKV